MFESCVRIGDRAYTRLHVIPRVEDPLKDRGTIRFALPAAILAFRAQIPPRGAGKVTAVVDSKS